MALYSIILAFYKSSTKMNKQLLILLPNPEQQKNY